MEGIDLSRMQCSLPPIPKPLRFEDLTEDQFKALLNVIYDFKFACSESNLPLVFYYVLEKCTDPVVKQELIDAHRYGC
ncbi:hypothetical protein [Bacillus cereus group sp. MG21]|uniref:hypothetical protein n=1 Tax=Bacillus cereus group sp. MG21 TaxID=3040251 RepID=UPI0033914CD9